MRSRHPLRWRARAHAGAHDLCGAVQVPMVDCDDRGDDVAHLAQASVETLGGERLRLVDGGGHVPPFVSPVACATSVSTPWPEVRRGAHPRPVTSLTLQVAS